MKHLFLPPLLLIFITGYVSSQIPSLPEGGLPPLPGLGEQTKPLCEFTNILPCINGAVKSYIRNTKGEEAAEGPPNAVDAQIVSRAMSADIADPNTDLNATCEIFVLLEAARLGECLEDAAKDCSVDPPEDDDILKDQLPAFRSITLLDLGNIVKWTCNDDCLLFPVSDSITAMTKCWKDAESALAHVKDTNVSNTRQTCSDIDYHVRCQWRHSVGCPLLEHLTRRYLQGLEPIITTCNVALPPEALTEVQPTTNGAPSMLFLTLQTLLVLVPLLQLTKNI